MGAPLFPEEEEALRQATAGQRDAPLSVFVVIFVLIVALTGLYLLT